MNGKTYRDEFTCPRCKSRRIIVRKKSVARQMVLTWCIGCRKTSRVEAGPQPTEGDGNAEGKS